MTSPLAWAQDPPQQLLPAIPCAAQPSYPLPKDEGELQGLSDRLQALSTEKACLADARFHAWRGAVLMALGRPVEAVEPLERALMTDPDLPGAQLDLAQALAFQGDPDSAVALLKAVQARPDLDESLRVAINTQLAALTAPVAGAANGGWHSRWRVAAFAGADSNLNNGPANSEITLTIPGGDLTLSLDPSSRPKRGGALLASAQWQGLKSNGESLWVVQSELRARQTAESATSYQQGDLAAAWLQAPAAPRQWVVRFAGNVLRFGGVNLLQAHRASLQRQFAPIEGSGAPALLDAAAGCRPTLAGEFEHRRYPSSLTLNGLYSGVSLGLLCRPANGGSQANGGAPRASFFNIEARLGEDRPADSTRAGGIYRRSELRVQSERPAFAGGQVGMQWTSTLQTDSAPYSELLGNIPRRTLRHALQLDGSWPLRGSLSLGTDLSLVATAEAAWQQSNIAAFVSRQRSLYLGLRWEK
ncbi:MAG: tetratricopeptide repeat protein [Ramlibacter sp.]|nr:tetratricopeptide repeat protein [Ramlibacter sp.]